MNLQLYKGLFKEFLKHEKKGPEKLPEINIKLVGQVQFVNLEGEKEKINFFIEKPDDKEDSKTNDASLYVFADDSIGIVMTRDYFLNSTENRLKAVIAHEVGHYVCNHHNAESYGRQLNVKTDRLDRLSNEAYDNAVKFKTYIRAMLFSLLRGGVVVRESEADAAAGLYVPLDDVIAIHTEDFTYKNRFTAYEKVNRVNWLNKLREREVLKKLPLELKLNGKPI